MTEVIFLCNSDGEPWAAFALGHLPKGSVTAEAVIKAADAYCDDCADAFRREWFDHDEDGEPVALRPDAPTFDEHLYMTHENLHGTPSEFDVTYYRCAEKEPGAFPVTGAMF